MCAVGNLRYTAIGLIIDDEFIVFFAVLTLWNKDREIDHFFIYISGSKRLPPYCTSLGQSREFCTVATLKLRTPGCLKKPGPLIKEKTWVTEEQEPDSKLSLLLDYLQL